MSLVDIAIAEKKMVAILRAEFALKQKFEKMAFEEEIIKPAIAKFRNNLNNGIMAEYSADFKE